LTSYNCNYVTTYRGIFPYTYYTYFIEYNTIHIICTVWSNYGGRLRSYENEDSTVSMGHNGSHIAESFEVEMFVEIADLLNRNDGIES